MLRKYDIYFNIHGLVDVVPSSGGAECSVRNLQGHPLGLFLCTSNVSLSMSSYDLNVFFTAMLVVEAEKPFYRKYIRRFPTLIDKLVSFFCNPTDDCVRTSSSLTYFIH